MGSAGGEIDPEVARLAQQLGQEIGERDCVLITGACPGLPHEAVLGAKAVGGLVVGVSPALSLDEHVQRYHSPYEEYDVLIFTGSGLMGREVENIRSCDIVIIIGGRSGTLGEFAIAYDEGKLIGVLQGTKGISDYVDEIVAMVNKQTDAQLIYHRDPAALMDRLLEVHAQRVAAGIAYRAPKADA